MAAEARGRPRTLLIALLLASLLACATGLAAPLRGGLPSRARLAPRDRRVAGVRCGPRVRIVSVGKTKEAWLTTAIDTYISRLRGVLEIECVWVRDDAALLSAVEKCRGEAAIVLDERGRTCTSVQFGERLYEGLEEGGSRLSFFIGGAEGLPAPLKAERRERLLSLSSLTFTHQMARSATLARPRPCRSRGNRPRSDPRRVACVRRRLLLV
jgi:23S rRNA (pseudouridine1915-N3)-methyltransferase